jgi:hypothetical protein
MPRKSAGSDQSPVVDHDQTSRVGTAAASESSHDCCVTHTASADSLAPIIAEIRAWHRQRVFAMDQRKRADLALGAFLRTQLGWSRNLPAAGRTAIAKNAAALVDLGEKIAKGKATGIGDSAFSTLGPVILAAIHSRAHWDAIEAAATKEMERLARLLPAWEGFGEGVKGFGARSLAVIVGEAGDLSHYGNPAKLWKRMGLAVMAGIRQGGLRKTASAEDWIAHGYSARRRSFMFVIGDVLIKNQNAYREVYLARKEIERAKAVAAGLTVAPAAKIPAKRKAEFMSDGHVHRRAQRYMEKRLLRDLWRSWRRANVACQPRVWCPPPDLTWPMQNNVPNHGKIVGLALGHTGHANHATICRVHLSPAQAGPRRAN